MIIVCNNYLELFNLNTGAYSSKMLDISTEISGTSRRQSINSSTLLRTLDGRSSISTLMEGTTNDCMSELTRSSIFCLSAQK